MKYIRSPPSTGARTNPRGLEGTIPRWGDAAVRAELHHSEPYRMGWD